MKRNGSTEGIRKLSEAVSATLWDETVDQARSFQTVSARFGQCISTSKQDSEHYQVRTRLIKHKVKFLSTIYVQFHAREHGTVRW